MSDFQIFDSRFAGLTIGHARLERLWTGSRWAEGPVYVPAAKSLLWSDIPNDRVMRFDETDGSVSTFESPCGHHNGHTLDAQGRVIGCLHGGRSVSRLDHDGVWRVLADRHDGRRFNSPNDVVVKSDGSVWFTDPTYGIDSHYEGHAAVSEIGASNVYRISRDGRDVTTVITDRVKPNGLAFSPDESILYVGDTGRSHVADHPIAISAYAMTAQGPVLSGTFARSDDGFYDGLRVDRDGNVWTSCGCNVDIHAPDGTLIGRIPLPEIVSNLCFGGPKRNRLYITAQTSLYALYVNAHPPGW